MEYVFLIFFVLCCFVCLSGVPYVASFSGLSILDCPFGFLKLVFSNNSRLVRSQRL
jgi:hypothetical protein